MGRTEGDSADGWRGFDFLWGAIGGAAVIVVYVTVGKFVSGRLSLVLNTATWALIAVSAWRIGARWTSTRRFGFAIRTAILLMSGATVGYMAAALVAQLLLIKHFR